MVHSRNGQAIASVDWAELERLPARLGLLHAGSKAPERSAISAPSRRWSAT
jgi:hypothetical protein